MSINYTLKHRKSPNRGSNWIALLIISLLLSACLGVENSLPAQPTDTPSSATSPPDPTRTPVSTTQATPELHAQDAGIELATPYADSPAAGICMESSGDAVVSVEIFPDIPSPRCIKVTAGQKLQVINRTDSALQLSLGGQESSLPAGKETTLDLPFGDFLMPGVHTLAASPFSGPEIWLQQ